MNSHRIQWRSAPRCLVVALTVSSPASAHVGILAGAQPLVEGGELLGGGTTYGLTLGDEAGWLRVCEEASPARANFFQRLEDGRIMVGTGEGLHVTDDSGCTYSEVPGLEGRNVTALVVRDDGSFLVSTATVGEDNGVFESADGAVFSPGAIADVDALFFSLVADGDEVWAVGTVPGAGSVIFRSDDEGETFDEVSPPEGLDLIALTAQGFDEDGALVLSGLRSGAGFALVRTDDGFVSVEDIASFSAEITAFAAFGGDRYVVVNSSGMWRQQDLAGEFSELTDGPARCVWVDESRDELWACGLEDDGALFFRTADGESWEPALDPARIEERACPAGTPGNVNCEPDEAEPDGGTALDGGTGDEPPVCGCASLSSMRPISGGAQWALATLIGTLILRRRKKNR